MPQANDIHGTVFKNGSAVLMARIVDSVDSNITQAAISSISYSVYEIDPCRPDLLTLVAGHDGVTAAVSSTIFDTLQTDNAWTVDAVGYNFRHELNVSTNDAFPVAGVSYQVRYELTPGSGQKVIVRFQLRAI